MSKTKFDGGNRYNNIVNVDFNKKSVKFTPVIRGSWKKYWGTFYMHMLSLFSWPLLIMHCAILLIIGPNLKNIDLVFASFGISYLIIPLAFSLTYFIPSFIPYYPKIMDIITNMNSGGKSINRKIVLPDQCHNNMYIVPKFSNVSFCYELEGDFCDISNIDIVPRFDKNEYDWYAVMTFNKKPIKGMMKLSFH